MNVETEVLLWNSIEEIYFNSIKTIETIEEIRKEITNTKIMLYILIGLTAVSIALTIWNIIRKK